MKTYETLFVINPDLEEDGITKTIDIIQELITTGGGTILKIDRWGRRQLAYQIQKKWEGYYVLMYFQAPSTLITELNRRYKLTDPIMRYLVMQLKKSQVEEILHSTGTTEVTVSEETSEVVVHDEDEQDEMIDSETEEEPIAARED